MFDEVKITSADFLKTLSIAQLANLIRKDWKKPYFGAEPYIRTMSEMYYNSVSGRMYGADTADSVIRYFMANASGWRGETAKAIKAELKRRVGMK